MISDRKKESNRRYYLTHKDSVRSTAKRYYDANLEKIRQSSRDYYHAHKAEISVKRSLTQRERYLKHREKILGFHKKHWAKMRLATLVLAGGLSCKRCGFDDVRALQIDHVFGDGAKERKTANLRNHYAMKKRVEQNPERYQVLCANCNVIKKAENREHPGRRINANVNEVKNEEAPHQKVAA